MDEIGSVLWKSIWKSLWPNEHNQMTWLNMNEWKLWKNTVIMVVLSNRTDIIILDYRPVDYRPNSKDEWYEYG